MSAHATLDSVDAIKHKLTDAEYKLIVDNLQRQHFASIKHFLIQYKVTQCWHERVWTEDDEVIRLMTSESKHTVIVRMKPTPDQQHTCISCSMFPHLILEALRSGQVSECQIKMFQEDIEKHGFYNNAHTQYGIRKGGTTPWAGLNTDSADVMTKLMIGACDEYTLLSFNDATANARSD